MATLLIWYAHGVAVNDLSDLDVDRINLSDPQQQVHRPLLNGAATPRGLRAVAIGLSLAMIATSALVAPWFALIGGAYVLLNLAYSLPPVRWSARGGVAQLMLPVGYVGLPALLAWAPGGAQQPSGAALAITVGLAVVFGGRLFLKDVRDVDGDRATGKRTFLVRHGLRRTSTASGTLIALGLLVSAVGLMWWRGSVVWVLAVAAPLLALAVGKAIARLRRADTRTEQLLWVGVVGRLGSTWVFGCTVVAVLLHGDRAPPGWQLELLTALGLIMFGVSLSAYRDELRDLTDASMGSTTPSSGQGPTVRP